MKQTIFKILTCIAVFIIGSIVNTLWLKVLLLFISYLIAGYQIILKALKNIKDKNIFDENCLMTIASLGAFILGEYPEAISVLVFFLIGDMLEEYAERKSTKSIENLMNIKPEYANLKIGDNIEKKSPQDVNIGDIVIVKPGERIPLDGIIISGNALIDTSALTGEPVLKTVNVGDEILSGTINTNALLEVKVTKKFSESTISKILDLIENASNKKAHTEKFITKFAKIYTPIVICLALIIGIIPPLIFKQDYISWLYRALTFLVISCPCALVVSIPLSFLGGIGGASKQGILVKGSNYLEMLSKTDKVVFDKTGTLTKGTFTVQKILPITLTEEELIEITAYAEEYSNHPIANSIKAYYNKEIKKDRISDYKEISGNGIHTRIDGREVLVGNSKLMQQVGIQTDNEETIGTIVYIAVDNKYEGKIIIADEIKENVQDTIIKLKKYGIKETIMLTGDNNKTGETVAKYLSIDKVYTELLPTDKVKMMQNIMKQQTDKKVIFVGDGLNDAPVLAIADIGIAMGAYGADAAIESADVVIMTDEISKILEAIKIAKKTVKIAKQNITIAVLIKILVLALSFFGLTTMWEAVFADVGVTVIAIINSLRTLNNK